jgi:cyclophilin family peptidyl-prolyl cis-trans isomerase
VSSLISPGIASKALAQDSLSASLDSTAAEDAAGGDTVVITLEEGGEIVIKLLAEEAPIAVARVSELIETGFYDGLTFHRVESYLIQTGDREHDYPPIEGEMFSQYIRHEEGMIGMARIMTDYDSATTQFYICKKELPSLNGEFTIFAKVVDGMDLVHEVKKGAKIKKIRFLGAD